jgi:hypothetical protein
MATILYISPPFRNLSHDIGVAVTEVCSILSRAAWVRCGLMLRRIVEYPLLSGGVLITAVSLARSPILNQACGVVCEIAREASIIVAKDIWCLCKRINRSINVFFNGSRCSTRSGFFY